jgi:hypothetical protein
VKDGQRELDITIVANTFGSLFTTRQALATFFIRALSISGSIELRTYHASIQRSIRCGRPDILLIVVVQIRCRDLYFGDSDNIFGCKRLKLDVLATWSVGFYIEAYILRGTSDET